MRLLEEGGEYLVLSVAIVTAERREVCGTMLTLHRHPPFVVVFDFFVVVAWRNRLALEVN